MRASRLTVYRWSFGFRVHTCDEIDCVYCRESAKSCRKLRYSGFRVYV